MPAFKNDKRGTWFCKFYYTDRNGELNEIKASTIRTGQDKLITHKDNYSQTYLKTINNQLSAILNFAANNEYIGSNPMHKCGGSTLLDGR